MYGKEPEHSGVQHPGNINLAQYNTQSEQYGTAAPAVPMANFDESHSNVGKRPYSGGAASNYRDRIKNTVTDDQLGQGVEMILPEQQQGQVTPSLGAGDIAGAAGSVAGVISDSIEVDPQSMGNETLGTFNYGDAGQITTKSALKGFQTGAKMGSSLGPVGTIVGGGIGAIAGSISGGKEARKQRDAAQDGYDNAVDNRFDNIDAQKGKYGGRLKQYADGGDLTEFNGQTHENGGIQLPAMDAEVEDGETAVDNYVFSDSLDLNKDMAKELNLPKRLVGKSFADVSKHLNDKFPRENDMFANKAKENYFERLKGFQESVRPKDPNGLFRDGGFFRDKATRQSDRDVKRWQKEDMDNNTDSITPNAPNNQRRLTMKPGQANDAIDGISRMAPILTAGINTARNSGPAEQLDLDMFSTSVPIEENLVNRDKIHDDIRISSRAADQGLRNASGGSRSTYLNNRLGLLDKTMSAQTNARIASDTADAGEKSKVSQLRLRQDAMNQRNRLGVQNINDQNEGVREGLMQDSIANLGNQTGDYGTEGYRRKTVNSMYDYKVDRNGNVHYKNKKKKK
jgi:hypothetical protein